MLVNLIWVGLFLLFLILRRQYKNKRKNANNNIIATITHDLKTPAVAHIRALELLLKGHFGEVTDSQKYFINDILNSCNNMLNMLVNLLWLYKFDNKKIAINSVSFCVNDLIEEIFKENKLLLASKKHQFEFNYSAGKIYIVADKLHIKHIISNLLSNSINHSKEASVIRIETSIVNGKFLFLIKNEGNYLSNDMLKCILDKDEVFNQKANGLSTGLGLYLANSLLQINNGELIHFTTSDNINIFGFSIELSRKKKQNFYDVITKPIIYSKKSVENCFEKVKNYNNSK